MGKEPLILHPEFKEHCDDVLFACQFRAVAHASEGEHVTADHERRCAAAIRGLLEILDSWTPPPSGSGDATQEFRRET